MPRKSKIGWTQITWNPSTGCTKISPGCKNCYAEKWSIMQQKRGISQYKEGFKFNLAKNRLKEPFSWKGRKLVFVNSMSDLFYNDMPSEYLEEVFNVMNNTPNHTYQILTKRIDRVIKYYDYLNWSGNIWLGVSVESDDQIDRIDKLKLSKAHLKFISFEPLLGNIPSVSFNGIDWIIVGGESGSMARPPKLDWVENLRLNSEKQNIPFFFKQWGKKEFNPDPNDPTLDKNHSLHSRGGCSLNRKVYHNFPNTYGTESSNN